MDLSLSDEEESWPKTQWSMIGRAKGDDDPERRSIAWRSLVELYRVPIEKVLRRYLAGCSDADEAVASFFGYLFEGKVLDKPDSEKGRFRAFIQGVARRYARHWRSERAKSWAFAADADLVDEAEPDSAAWLPTLIDVALSQMREKDARLLRQYYGLGLAAPSSGEEIAHAMGITRSAVYKRVEDNRWRLKEKLEGVIRQLSADDVAEALEMAWLNQVLAIYLKAPSID